MKINFLIFLSPFSFFIFSFITSRICNPASPHLIISNYVNQTNSNITNSLYYKNTVNPLVNDFINNLTLISPNVTNNPNTIIQNYIGYLLNNPMNILYNSLSFALIWKIYSQTRYNFYFRYTQSLYNMQSNSTNKKVKLLSKLAILFNRKLKNIFNFFYNL